MAVSSVGVFLTFDPSWLMGFWSLLVLIFAFQAARVNDFSRTTCPRGSRRVGS